MATPYFDSANSTWKIKVKDDLGKWKAKTLGKGVKSDTPPPDILHLAAPHMGRTIRPSAPSVESDGPTIDAYCDLYASRYRVEKKTESLRRLGYVLTHLRTFAKQQGIVALASVG